MPVEARRFVRRSGDDIDLIEMEAGAPQARNDAEMKRLIRLARNAMLFGNRRRGRLQRQRDADRRLQFERTGADAGKRQAQERGENDDRSHWKQFYTRVLHEGSTRGFCTGVLHGGSARRFAETATRAIWRRWNSCHSQTSQTQNQVGICELGAGIGRASGHRMAKSFREMVAWQLAFELEERTVALIAASPEANRDFAFRDQLREACKSVPSNIAEGYGRYRPTEIARFLEFAIGSLDETESRLRSGVSSRYFKAEDVGPLIRLAARCRTAMMRWQAYLRRTKNDPRFNSRRKDSIP